MSSLLQNPAAEYCQSNNLRGRRFSFNPPRPQDLLSHLRSGHNGQADDIVLIDEIASDLPVLPKEGYSPGSSPPLSPLDSVHMAGYSTTVHLPRHHDSYFPSLSATTSPSSSVPPSAFVSREPSIIDFNEQLLLEAPVKGEHYKRRLSSVFFLYFMCGWGDGGEFFDLSQARHLSLIHI